MLEVLRNFNANALKQALRSAEEMGRKSKSNSTKNIIKEMIALSDKLDIAIQEELILGAEYSNIYSSCKNYKNSVGVGEGVKYCNMESTESNHWFIEWFSMVADRVPYKVAQRIWNNIVI